jgi:hypothetical protein
MSMPNDIKKHEEAYAYTRRSSYRGAKPAELSEHTERVRDEVVPEIKEQMKKKEAGAQKVRSHRIF